MLNGLPKVLANRYEVIRQIGQGGVGSVLLCNDLSFHREVAVKILHPLLSQRDDVKKRFLREARAMANFNHSNLCTVYDLGEHDGWIFMVMERLQTTAHQLTIHEKGLSPQRCLKMLDETLAGLEAIHDAGMVHRDIKPANLLIGLDGCIRIGDFGIVRHDQSKLTRTGTVMGTLSYMPPEQRVDSHHVDHRADLYAAAASIFAIATAKMPPDLSLIELKPNLLSVVPWPLKALIRRACQADPRKRFPTARHMRRTTNEIRYLLDLDEEVVSASAAPKSKALPH